MQAKSFLQQHAVVFSSDERNEMGYTHVSHPSRVQFSACSPGSSKSHFDHFDLDLIASFSHHHLSIKGRRSHGRSTSLPQCPPLRCLCLLVGYHQISMSTPLYSSSRKIECAILCRIVLALVRPDSRTCTTMPRRGTIYRACVDCAVSPLMHEGSGGVVAASSKRRRDSGGNSKSCFE